MTQASVASCPTSYDARDVVDEPRPCWVVLYPGDTSPVLLPVPQYLTSTRTSQLVMVNWFTKNGSIRDIASPRCLVSQKARMSSVLSHCDMEYPASESFSSRMKIGRAHV